MSVAYLINVAARLAIIFLSGKLYSFAFEKAKVAAGRRKLVSSIMKHHRYAATCGSSIPYVWLRVARVARQWHARSCVVVFIRK